MDVQSFVAILEDFEEVVKECLLIIGELSGTTPGLATVVELLLMLPYVSEVL